MKITEYPTSGTTRPPGKTGRQVSLMALYGINQRILNVRAEHNHRIRERCAVFRRSKFQPTFDKEKFTLGAEVVPPASIYPGRQQTNDRGPVFLCAPVCFFNPLPNFPAIGRVHPADSLPVLRQPVHVRRKEPPTFGIFRQGADICFKPEYPVQPVKECLRSCPQIRITRKHQIVVHTSSQDAV